jgi:hypothetical protein
MTSTATQIYGVDLKMSNKDLVLSSSGGFDFIAGNNNILQALTNRLSTEKGSLAYNANYGTDLSTSIGEKNIFIKQQIIKTIISNAIMQDPRIASIQSLQVNTDSQRPDTYNVFLSVFPIGNNSQSIILNFVYPFFQNQTNVRIPNENVTSIDNLMVNTTYNIYSVQGVWLSTDTNKIGVNFYQGTSSGFSGNTINLSYQLPSSNTSVIIDYNKLVQTNVGIPSA